MLIHFFIGTLDLSAELPDTFQLQRWDDLFLHSVLPPTYQARIHMEISDRLPSVPEQIHFLEKIQWWMEDESEYRIYSMQRIHDAPGLMSCYTKSEEICLYADREWWSRCGNRFQLWHYIHMEELLLGSNALVLHSASIIYRGLAILFTAPSGTGKTTQTNLWHRYLEDVTDLNGDQTVLQYTEKGWYACGFPTCGSSDRCGQYAVPIRAIVIVRQGAQDELISLSPSQKLLYLYSECTVPSMQPKYVEQALSLLDNLVQSETVIQLNCTMNESAVQVLHQYLYGGE